MTDTQHYQLNQWAADDQVLRTDFNADNAKIDAALAGKGKALFGGHYGRILFYHYGLWDHLNRGPQRLSPDHGESHMDGQHRRLGRFQL